MDGVARLDQLLARASIWFTDAGRERLRNGTTLATVEDMETSGACPSILTSRFRDGHLWSFSVNDNQLVRMDTTNAHYCTLHSLPGNRAKCETIMKPCEGCQQVLVTNYGSLLSVLSALCNERDALCVGQLAAVSYDPTLSRLG